MKASHLTIVASGALLGGCATNFAAKAAAQCAPVAASTAAYSDCVERAEAEMRSSHRRTWNAIAAGFGGAAAASRETPSYQPTLGGTAMGTAFLRSSYVSGMNRVCQYNRSGSAYVITIGAAEMCPLTVP